MRSSERTVEWRGLPALCAGLVGVALYASDGTWTWALVAGGIAVLAALGCLLQDLKLRAAMLGLTAVLLGVPALYLLAMYPPFGLVLSIVPILAAWGAIRAARGHQGVPHPLA